MVTNVYVKFTYDRLRIDKASGNLKPDNNKNDKNNPGSAWEPFSGSKRRDFRVSKSSPLADKFDHYMMKRLNEIYQVSTTETKTD